MKRAASHTYLSQWSKTYIDPHNKRVNNDIEIAKANIAFKNILTSKNNNLINFFVLHNAI